MTTVEAEADDEEAEHHPRPLGQAESAAAAGRAGEPPGGRRHLLRRDGSQVCCSASNSDCNSCNFRRDIVFPGDIFPDSTQNWDTIDMGQEDGNVGKNNKNDGKPGVMTRW